MTEQKMQSLLLTWAIVLMFVLSLAPFLLIRSADGKSDHVLSVFLMWSMSASFVRGIGFIPKNRPARYLLGSIAAIVTAMVSAGWWYHHHPL